MWVKLCGNTRLEDCLLAAELGADAVGFVFAPGKRTVTAPQVAVITACLPPTLEKIGVFTTRESDTIVATAAEAGLTGIQLHGQPDRVLVDELRASTNCKLIQVLHWRTDVASSEQREGFAAQLAAVNTWGAIDAVLIDSSTASSSGGTGITFDWAAVAPLLKASRVPIIAAGGLKPATVAAAIATLKPRGMDVSSGVESAPGVKDAEEVRAFIAAAKG